MENRANRDVFGYKALGKNISKDEYFVEAAHAIFRTNKTSIGTLQRELGIDFERACKLMEQLITVGLSAGRKALSHVICS